MDPGIYYQVCVVVVLHECGSKVLVQETQSEQGSTSALCFPRVLCPESYPQAGKMCAHLARLLEPSLGLRLDLTYLFSTFPGLLVEDGPPVIMILECSGQHFPLFKDFHWLDVDSVCLSRFHDADDKRAIPFLRKCTSECEEDGLRPWARPGWLKETTKLVSEALASLDFIVSGLEQYIVHCESSVLKVQTDKGLLFLKASNRREGLVMEYVSKISPSLARKPLYINSEKEWMVLDDFGPTLVGNFPRRDFEKIQTLYAQMQLMSVSHLDDLARAGVPQVNPASIVERARAMLVNESVWVYFCKCRGYFRRTESRKSDVKEHCALLTSYLTHLYDRQKVPLTLVHGDLHSNNICPQNSAGDDFVIFDWATARIDLPLWDMGSLSYWVSSPESNKRNIDIYLRSWKEFVTVDELKALMSFGRWKNCLVSVLEEYEGTQSWADIASVKEHAEDLSNILYNVRESMQNTTIDSSLSSPSLCRKDN